MKKLGSLLLPIATFLLLTVLGGRVLSGGLNPMFIGALAILFVMMFLFSKNKTGPAKNAEAVMAELLDDYAADAFSEDETLKGQFYSALSDYGKNMPKAAVAKLEKLAPLCKEPKDKYAVALAAAKTNFKLQKFSRAILEYNKAVVVHPTCEVAVAIGDCYQRLGDLKKAQDSYEFAIELDPQNPDPCSRLATTYVADWDYNTALYYAEHALTLDENYASALATAAICHGMLGNNLLRKSYTDKAVSNGYSEKKITETIDALKKRSK